jgi:hypothetical protein
MANKTKNWKKQIRNKTYKQEGINPLRAALYAALASK